MSFLSRLVAENRPSRRRQQALCEDALDVIGCSSPSDFHSVEEWAFWVGRIARAAISGDRLGVQEAIEQRDGFLCPW